MNGDTVDHADALALALRLSDHAAARLRAEFFRSGGPRGADDHAAVDAEIEAEIRAGIAAAFPSHGMLGEELGVTPAAVGEVHVWAIDPDDGTSALLAGQRGSAVSIALLREGVPVLGVVHVHAGAAGPSERFSWAEGCGPLQHRGRAIERPAFARTLASRHCVLVSPAADASEHASIANAQLCAPARFVTLPSVAHRLARVAIGEAELACALHRPRAWDLAAGHALLRAVGGELVDERGQPIRYGVMGELDVERCFGGAPELVGTFARRDWARVHAEASGPLRPLPLRAAMRGWVIEDDGALDRARGCMLGQLAGDSLGSLVEFMPAEDIAALHPGGVRALADGGPFSLVAGQPTDDSELALSLARAMLDAGGFDIEAIARAYAAWYASHPFDIGGTTRTALAPAAAALAEGGSVADVATRAAMASEGSEANGALMRVSPLGLLGWRLPAGVLAELARRDAALTHPSPVCRDASALFVVCIAHAIAQGPTPRQLFEFAGAWASEQGLHADVRACVDAAEHAPPREFQRSMGWVRIALHNAFHQLRHAATLEQGLVDTVMRGGDTDTNAAIAGALLGAVYGGTGVPLDWRERVLSCRPVAGLEGVRRARAPTFWPVDAERIAEHLLVVGVHQNAMPPASRNW